MISAFLAILGVVHTFRGHFALYLQRFVHSCGGQRGQIRSVDDDQSREITGPLHRHHNRL